MRAIISSRRRTQVYQKQLNLVQLTKFIKQYFPRMKQPQLSYKDPQGNMINIKSNDDVEKIKNIYHGQNFVELFVADNDKSGENNQQGWHGGHHGGHHGWGHGEHGHGWGGRRRNSHNHGNYNGEFGNCGPQNCQQDQWKQNQKQPYCNDNNNGWGQQKTPYDKQKDQTVNTNYQNYNWQPPKQINNNERKKKNVLKALIDMFGVDNVMNYSQFIDYNINLSEDQIINKWIGQSKK